ncbi:unnamed protein product [Notodromas monacha]|uniref:K Homology domain-containing protein n=1 Tax=Notodromas monacha TaxID=399045 RepID=A0A7R9BH52_9CRUS|nr:unnamed protein product [Notodromas monacha]CAG0913810.1 unnamed protein product [Notodromas monacha]
MDQDLMQRTVDFEPVVGGIASATINAAGDMNPEINGAGSASAFEPHIPVYSYDDLFPALPETSSSPQDPLEIRNQWNQKMRLGSSIVTQAFCVPYEERRRDGEQFGSPIDIPTSVCQQIQQATGAHIEISNAKDKSLTFLVTGKYSDVLDARRRIQNSFQMQLSQTLKIPKEHHRYIIGNSGKKLQELEKMTATKISIPKQEDKSNEIVVTGTKEGIEKAFHEMQIISDEQSKQAYERMEVPKKYHPFISGGNTSLAHRLMSEYNVRINVPPNAVMKDEITVAGEKEGVSAVVVKIEKMIRELNQNCTVVSVEVKKSQHKYVIGPKGSTIAEIMDETGVSVEVPPSDSPSGTITLRGPQEKLSGALNMLYAKANSVVSASVPAPAWLHKYIIGKKGANIRQITQDLPKVHVEFTANGKIELEGPPKEVEQAQQHLERIAQDLINRMVYKEITIDPKYHPHIIGKQGANVNRIKQEMGVLVNIPESGGSVIRIEGGPVEVEKACKEITDMVEKMEKEKEKDIIIDHRFHGTIIGAKGDKIREIREKFPDVNITFPDPSEKSDVVKIRGPRDQVDQCHRHLTKLTKEIAESNFQIKVPIFKQFHRFVIGKGGSNIRKIREETLTRIDLPVEGSDSDVIVITGKKENAEQAKELIQKIQNEMANIVSLDIIIPKKFHNSMIGSGGKLIQSISQDCGGVSIKFPSPESSSDKVTIRGPKEDVDKARKLLVDLSTERQMASFTAEVRAKPQHHRFLIGRAGANIRRVREETGARIVFPSEKDDDREAITIIGKKEGVERAKLELEKMIRDLDSVAEVELHVNPKYHRHFVARRAEVLRDIAEEFGGVTVSFPRSGDDSDRVVIKGAKNCVDGAKARILDIVSDLEQMVTIDVVIPQKHHRTVMGTKGSKVQALTAEFDVQIKFPERELDQQIRPVNGEVDVAVIDEPVSKRDIIRVTGKLEKCEAAKDALLNLIPVSIEVEVPYDMHRFIIGQKGADVRKMMETYDVSLSIPSPDEHSDKIRITGSPSNVERARLALLDRVKQLNGEMEDRKLRGFTSTVSVDSKYHPKIIGRRGAVVTKLRERYGVNIQFPKKEDADQDLITVIGYEDKVEEAKSEILKMVNEYLISSNLQEQMMEKAVSVDSRVHPRLIGQKGRTIKKIMDDYKVDIRFPRPEDADPNVIFISGDENNVLDAEDAILNMEHEFMQDLQDSEMTQSYMRAPSKQSETNHGRGDGEKKKGFVVTGAPWDQPSGGQSRAPDMTSNEDFPSFGAQGGLAGDGESGASAPVAWGPRKARF